MAISDSNSKKAHQEKVSHLANIVRLAKVDEVVTQEEQEFLDRLAKRLEIEKEAYHKIFKNPEVYSIKELFFNDDDRIERLYNLTDVIFIDGEIVSVEVDLLQKIAIDLGFSTTMIEKICDKAIHLIINNYSKEVFIKKLKELIIV